MVEKPGVEKAVVKSSPFQVGRLMEQTSGSVQVGTYASYLRTSQKPLFLSVCIFGLETERLLLLTLYTQSIMEAASWDSTGTE